MRVDLQRICQTVCICGQIGEQILCSEPADRIIELLRQRLGGRSVLLCDIKQMEIISGASYITAVGIKAELLVHLSACVPIPLISASACWLLLRGACPANRWLPPSMSVSRR